MAKLSQFEGTEQQKNDIPKDGTTLKDDNITGTGDAFEYLENEMWSLFRRIAKLLSEIVEFTSEDEEKDVPKRQSSDQTKVEDRPNPGKVKGDITGLSSRWTPTRWQHFLEPQRRKQMTLTFTLMKMCSYSLVICSPLPGAVAESTFEKVAMNITITPGRSLSVTYPVPPLPTGAHFSIIRVSGNQELNCFKTFVEGNHDCMLGPGKEGPCQALILYHLGSRDFLQLEGNYIEPGTYKYCIIQQVPENFVVYEYMVAREPDPTVPSICQNVTAVTELPITPHIPADGKVAKSWRYWGITAIIILVGILITGFLVSKRRAFKELLHMYQKRRQISRDGDPETPPADANETSLSLFNASRNRRPDDELDSAPNDQRMKGLNGHARVDEGGEAFLPSLSSSRLDRPTR